VCVCVWCELHFKDNMCSACLLVWQNLGSRSEPGPFVANVVSNQKYTLITFLPLFLFEQFRYFFNLYFLLVALSQFIPVLQIGQCLHAA